MKSSAPGQLLGYSFQFPRALFHLLHIPVDGCVGVEVLGDVTSFTNGKIIVEEDKSSISSNPLTDRSKDLWKTLYNWITAINAGEIDSAKSQFVLYTNKSGRPALVNTFHEAQSIGDAKAAIQKTKLVLSDINKEHEIWEYYDYVINKNENVLLKLIQKFEIQISGDTGLDEVKNAIREKLIPEEFVEHLLDYLLGWLQKTIIEKIAAKTPAIIKFDDFNTQFIAFFHRIRARSLIDWTLNVQPKKDSIAEALRARPCYVKQLDIISLSDEEIVEAVSDFIKADINRSKWIETGLLDEDSAIDFEMRLLSFWKNTINEVKITNPNISDEQKGQLLFVKCKNRQETINSLTPPDRTIPGTYHALSDRREVGWHPNWMNKLE